MILKPCHLGKEECLSPVHGGKWAGWHLLKSKIKIFGFIRVYKAREMKRCVETMYRKHWWVIEEFVSETGNRKIYLKIARSFYRLTWNWWILKWSPTRIKSPYDNFMVLENCSLGRWEKLYFKFTLRVIFWVNLKKQLVGVWSTVLCTGAKVLHLGKSFTLN